MVSEPGEMPHKFPECYVIFLGEKKKPRTQKHWKNLRLENTTAEQEDLMKTDEIMRSSQNPRM